MLSTWAVSTLAGSPSDISGSSNGVGTLARFNRPRGLLLTSDGMYVYVVDRTNNVICRVEVSSRLVVTVAHQSSTSSLLHSIGVTWLTQDAELLVSRGLTTFLTNALVKVRLFDTCTPTVSPTHTPTRKPTSSPTRKPTRTPTVSPTLRPTLLTHSPSTSPPSSDLSAKPSGLPSGHPSSDPTCEPSATPTSVPTERASHFPAYF